MSWLKELAGRAEHYLDKIDQNTAVVLQNQKDKLVKEVFKVSPNEENITVDIDTKPSSSIPSSPNSKSSLKKSKQDARISDEHLLEYLNGPDETLQTQYEGYSTGNLSIESRSIQLAEENMILKNEIKTLNNEISLFQYKLKSTDKDLNQIATELEINKRHSVNLEKELEEAQIQLKNVQDVMIRLKKKSDSTRQQVNNDYENSSSGNSLLEENEILKLEISKLKKKIEIDEFKKNELESEKLNLETKLNDVQFKNNFSTQNELQYLNLITTDCDALIANSRSDLNNISKNIKDILDDLEVTFVQITNPDRSSDKLDLEQAKKLTKLNSIKSNLLAIDCGLQKTLHDHISFKERLANLSSEHIAQNKCCSYSSQKDNLEQIISLQNALTIKQIELDQLSTDKKTMAIRIESLEARLKKETSLLINVNDTDDAKAKIPQFMLENAFDTGVARKVKRAFTSLDSIGLRTGMYLRRYPLLRTLLFIYVVTLHLWVMLILFSYTPETN
ncbi:golgin-84 [Daktulosphaira vitifoliae]|uniref:golgin-84 n=1 Tax=Daktulosphaira vitifoliae TaxID=58002 RepID=UPI0021AA4B69|nr:golgin-84 [Daktulosphaira vitifoliae]